MVKQEYIAISYCCLFLSTYFIYLLYILFPTFQAELGYTPSYVLTKAQQDIANDKLMFSLTHLTKWKVSIIIIVLVIVAFLLIRKFIRSSMTGFITSIITVAIILAIGLILLGQLQQEQIISTEAFNITSGMIGQLGTVPNWIGILISVAFMFLILGFFYNRDAF